MSFWGCNKTQTKEINEEPILELISYNWSYYDEFKKLANGERRDTTIIYVKNNLYAQIFENGNCFVSKYKSPYKEDLYSNFKVDSTFFNTGLRKVVSTLKICILTLKFNETKRSNSRLVNIYNYINLKTDSVGSNEKLFQARENRMKEIYNFEFDSVPKIIKSTVQFSVPDIQ